MHSEAVTVVTDSIATTTLLRLLLMGYINTCDGPTSCSGE